MAVAVDFHAQLAKQLRYLETSSRVYDAGDHDEAIRIAQALRVIFHNTPQSRSLLAHLGATATPVLSANTPRPKELRIDFWPGLVQTGVLPVREVVASRPKLDAPRTATAMSLRRLGGDRRWFSPAAATG